MNKTKEIRSNAEGFPAGKVIMKMSSRSLPQSQSFHNLLKDTSLQGLVFNLQINTSVKHLLIQMDLFKNLLREAHHVSQFLELLKTTCVT